jgi:hypothetical protein
LLRKVSALAKGSSRAIVVLENGLASSESVQFGADIVSSSIGGSEARARPKTRQSKGGWLDPRDMNRVPFGELVAKYGKSGLPCNCPWCKRDKGFVNARDADWNRSRKFHYLWTMEKYLDHLASEIERKRN